MKKLIVANWKQLPETLGQAKELLVRTDECARDLNRESFSMVICPPLAYIEEIAKLLKSGALAESAALGAQDIEPVAQLTQLGVRYVIIGHSDRRWKMGESNEATNTKLIAALRAGFTPIVCLGERTRDVGWDEELRAQSTETFASVSPGQIAQCIIAYEPVWSISTNPGATPDTPARAVQSMGLIRETFSERFDVSHVTFLYGGSVTPENASEFLIRHEISGLLIGGASVRSEDYCRILTIASAQL